jgi:3,4-dihydroxy 2-butanone 4-phosphate synthase/GTP cyclohydrolase II
MSGQENFNTVEEGIAEIAAGRMIVVVDDEDRENEGDLIAAADTITAEDINFMATYARGLICTPITAERADELELEQMVAQNTESMETAFTISVDASSTTTGISAFERAETIRILVDPKTRAQDLRRPGHVFPLRAIEGGVLRRAGHTEATVDLARLAGLYPAGVCCEIMNDDGTMARVPQLFEFADKHNLKIITIADLIKYRRHTEKLIRRVTATSLPTKYGDFTAVGSRFSLDQP